MSLDPRRVRDLLDEHQFEELFREELYWSRPALRETETFELAGGTYTRRQVAEAGGVAAFVVEAETGDVPDAAARKAVYADMEQTFGEPLLIFVDARKTQSLWTYARREGSKVLVRSHLYAQGQPVDLFLSKLAGLLFEVADFDDTGRIPLLRATERVRRALDVEGVTKTFFKAFRREHDALIEAIDGIPNEGDKRWYASVLLTRLMFVYFLQKKGFLDGGNRYYLEDKLKESKQRLGDDEFYQGYFQELVQALFFQGLATLPEDRDLAVVQRIGVVPYLNGGLFLKHEVEQRYDDTLNVPDEAFESLLAVFGQYEWYLDPEERPDGTQSRDFLNPDVLGYIFEKYINQKAFGAYYTRPEITEYLCDRTIDGLLLDAVNDPPAADAMLAAHDKAPHRFETLSDLLVGMDDRLCQRLLDQILPRLTLLDPACGSGAFLVAALKKLLTVYQAAVGRAKLSGDPDLRDWIQKAEREHASLAYFLKRKIITENLFGVDLMEEATEIAKLRLFLALVASARTVDELEPLPNVDYNVMAGNSLVGLLHIQGADFQRYAQTDLFGKNYPQLLHDKNVATDQYRYATGLDPTVNLLDTRDKARRLREEAAPVLNHVLLGEMSDLGIKYEQAKLDGSTAKYTKRELEPEDVSRLEPFHWGFEFDRVLARGGFDGILANPPWSNIKAQPREFFMDYADVVTKNGMDWQSFESEKDEQLQKLDVRASWLEYLSSVRLSGNLFKSGLDYEHQVARVDGRRVGSDYNTYKLFLERCWRLLKPKGRCGILLPNGIYSQLGAKGLRQLLFDASSVDSLFAFSNERYLFDDVHHSFQFVILTFSKKDETESFKAAFRFNPREAIGKAHLSTFLQDDSQHVEISTDLVRRLQPDTLAVLELRSELDKAIAQKMAEFPVLGDGEGGWGIALDNEFHSGSGRKLFKKREEPGWLPVFEGKVVHQFDISFAPIEKWIDEVEGRSALTKRRMEDDGQFYNYQVYRLAYRDVTRSTDSRTLIATILPPDAFHTDTLPSLKVVDEKGERLIGDHDQLYLSAVWNSLVLDWLVRQQVATHCKHYHIYQLPVPRLTAADPAFRPLVEAAARLTCVGEAFAPLAQSVGVDPAQAVTEAEGRAALRAEVDARVALVYGLDRAELEHILGTFPLVEDDYKAAVMEAFNALADAALAPPDDADTARLAAAGESDRVEFKSTLRRALNPSVPDHAIETAALKTVAAFLNTDGGTLLVGVDDDGQPLGLDHDGFASEDKLLLHLRNLVANRLNLSAFRHLAFRIVDLSGKRLLRVDVRPSDAPVFMEEKGKGESFYVRTGPSTTPLSMSETVDYVGKTFPRAVLTP